MEETLPARRLKVIVTLYVTLAVTFTGNNVSQVYSELTCFTLRILLIHTYVLVHAMETRQRARLLTCSAGQKHAAKQNSSLSGLGTWIGTEDVRFASAKVMLEGINI